MLTPSMGLCATPLTLTGSGRSAASRIVGTISMTWWNWLRMPPASLIRAGHDMTMPLRVPPKWEATSLVHLIGRVQGPGPRHRIVRVGLVGAPGIVELHVFGDRRVDAVQNGKFAVQAIERAFGAGAVVTADVDDESVFELADVLDRLDHTADLVVGIGQDTPHRPRPAG